MFSRYYPTNHTAVSANSNQILSPEEEERRVFAQILVVNSCAKQPLEGHIMEPVTISRRNQSSKKGNKENTEPPTGAKSFIKTGKSSVVPFQPRGNKKEDALNKNDLLKGKSKPMDRKAASAVVPTKAQTLRPAEAPKPPSKPAPGMYKGRIVQSKIGSIWKSSDTLNAAAAAPKPESEKVRDTAKKNRSRSVAEAPRQVPNRQVPMRSKSVTDKPHQVSRPAVGALRPAGFCSTRPPTRTIPAVASTKPGGNQNTKPKVPATEKKAFKPAVSSTLSQYRATMETAEEKRAKLAEWLASKGKTLKRPAMTTVAPPKTKLSTKATVGPKVLGGVELQLAAPCKAEPDPSLKTQDRAPDIEAPSEEVIRTASPGIVNTTLDLLDDSDQTESQGRVDDIVLNLCDALEAMVTPSRSSDDAELKSDQSEGRGSEEIKAEPAEEAEIGDLKVKQEDEESDEEDVMETTPPADASIIKYSVKTTPYLQRRGQHVAEKGQHQRPEVSDTRAPLQPHPANLLPPALHAHRPRPLRVVSGRAGEAGRRS
ncbi:PREDICTED: cytoskeleton-associated protein 2-like isoform X2 [Cyprinodon variegatus]|uniref:cytoskeleton-associated protein 2-like isoform X2 n=1 Tax=Cyprinodon variegatus TaxID=28743 RepID=UPI00074278C6|nr:PREDICTED: cytoskeleton-associated protein 2-like isoform X2 [Cyprinodon variegatus]